MKEQKVSNIKILIIILISINLFNNTFCHLQFNIVLPDKLSSANTRDETKKSRKFNAPPKFQPWPAPNFLANALFDSAKSLSVFLNIPKLLKITLLESLIHYLIFRELRR